MLFLNFKPIPHFALAFFALDKFFFFFAIVSGTEKKDYGTPTFFSR
jgi:hypothetical protein